MSRHFKICAVCADIHIGNRTVSADDLKKQLKKNFFEPLSNFPYLDGIIIAGDLTHCAISLNSEYSQLFHWFVDKVYKLAKKKQSTVVVIRGTTSHDLDQLSSIRHYIHNEDGVDFRIYETIEEIILWDDYKVLILPDVKVKQLAEIDKYLDTPKKYDMIIGHGMIKELQHVEQESENTPTKTYVYDTEKLMRACKGPILFGHVHQYQHLRQKFYYVGPFTMLERGWQDAGFAVVGICDSDRTRFKVEHYINPDSAEYYDLHISKKLLDTVPIDEIIQAIDEVLAEAKPNDLMTIRITRSGDLESSDKVMLIESRYQKDRRVSIVKKIKTKAEEQSEMEHEELLKKYAYLMDESIELPALAYQYYIEDYKPTIADQRSPAAMLTEQDFIDAFKVQEG